MSYNKIVAHADTTTAEGSVCARRVKSSEMLQ